MCGIAGIYTKKSAQPAKLEILQQMLALLQHRGPDEFGIYRDPNCSLVNARLSIIDIGGGQQPIANEDESLWIVYNGELFNDLALKKQLLNLGHNFTTESDTEVMLHLYQEYGVEFLQMVNGQFALAIWDSKNQTLFLARDRIGIRPLFYTEVGNQFLFASEMKSFLAVPEWSPEIDSAVLKQVFTYWAPLSPNTIFKDVYEVPAGHYLLLTPQGKQLTSYWQPQFNLSQNLKHESEFVDEFGELLINAAQIRLRADVPVGAYLSGGLDSATIAATIQNFSEAPLETFSIQFSDPRYDETSYQDQMVNSLHVNHHSISCSADQIGAIFPQVIWHTETPILRTSPAPMMLLSKLVHQNKYKVVLTGEGADEILGGYDIFKENAVRRYLAANPNTDLAPELYSALYPEIPQFDGSSPFLQAFFAKDIEETDSPFYSHHLRWSNTARSHRFLSQPNNQKISAYQYPLALPRRFKTWSPLAQAQYLEIKSFLIPYLLSSQGDRMAMANSVEGRYPFLDYRVIEFAGRLPDDLKLRNLEEKWILRKFASELLPQEIWQRRKKPYRAPIHHSFLGKESLSQTEYLFAEDRLEQSGYFSPSATKMLLQKAKKSSQLSEMEEMAFVGIISTQILHQQFCQHSMDLPKFNTNIPLKTINLVANH